MTDCTGKIKSLSIDFKSGKLIAEIEINEKIPEQLEELSKLDKLSLQFKKFRKKRSLDANAYFHLLVGKIASSMSPPISKQRCKNILIFRYGQPLLDKNSNPIFAKVNIEPEKVLENETIHCLPCGEKSENGTITNFYKVFRGSHTYDTKEMSVLIDGTVQEAKDLGIETATPDQIAEMKEKWHI